MSTRRTGITFLLAGIFAVICLSSDAVAAPTKASRAARHTSQNSAPRTADIEATLRDSLKDYKESEQKLQARIRDLEAAQKKLLERIAPVSEQENIQALQARIHDLEEEREKLLEKLQSDASSNWILGGVSVFTFVLCIIFLLRMNRPKTVDESWTPPESATPTEVFFPPGASAPNTPAATAKTVAPQILSPFLALPDWDSASPALNLQSLKALTAKDGTPSRNSTIELAEIMLSYGRANSAAEALANYIENSPKEAFAPWLKLLEVYRASGQRSEFDRIAQKLNKTFNVWTVDWDNFDDALAPLHRLDAMPHIMERLQELWGTRECQAYLQHLLRDTRDETRRGFPLAAIDDILCLSDILDHYLGTYTRVTNDCDDDSSWTTSPVTEIEEDRNGLPVLAEGNDAEQNVGGQQAGSDESTRI